MTDQWARWRHALNTGTRIESERGNPPSGFYKNNTGRGAKKPIEAIAIYRDDDGNLQCIRDVYGDGSKMDADQIEDLFASCSAYPISEEIYRAVTERGEPWPPEYLTRLSLKECQSNIVWTPELGRRKLGADAKPQPDQAKSTPDALQSTPSDAAQNPRAVIGDNNPPEEMTLDAKLRAEISHLSATMKAFLGKIGGKPRNKAEADQMADFATKFGQLSQSAEDQHKVEKAPVLAEGKAVDAKWFGLRDNAALARGRCLTIGQEWMDAENARRAEEARLANEAVTASAEKAAKQFDAPVTAPPPVEAEKITNIGNMRTVATRERPVWIVTDAYAWGAHLLAEAEIAPDLIEVLTKIAQRRGAAGATDMPGVKKEIKRSAA